MADTQIPNGRNALLGFYEAHADRWAASAAAVGLSPELAAAMASTTAEAAEAREAMIAARNAAKLATAMFYEKIETMRATGSAAVATIRAFAEATNNVEVYRTAEVSPAADRSPPPPPQAPSTLHADPNADGTVRLTWKGTLSRNQSFDVERSIDGGAYTLLKNVRGKNYRDAAVPSCAGRITYRLYGVRNNVRSSDVKTTQVLFGNVPAVAMQAALRGAAGAQAA